MSKIHSASFVAKDWIKSMPCGQGLEDCDAPDELSLPGSREGGGVQSVDVMKVLGLKRAKSIDSGNGDDTLTSSSTTTTRTETPTTNLKSTPTDDNAAMATTDDDDPCWQDIYDEDCCMSKIHSASFVAKDWIKSMPCGQGLEDCDAPDELSLPGSREGGGVQSVDVMKVLGLKRAKSVDSDDDDDDDDTLVSSDLKTP